MQTHGISLGLHRHNNCYFMNMKVVGKLTHEDYEIMIPKLEAFMKDLGKNKVNAYIDITELEGWELQAAWDDFKFGLFHQNDFEKIAMVGSNPTHEWLTKIANWFTFGELKYFQESNEALRWIEKIED